LVEEKNVKLKSTQENLKETIEVVNKQNLLLEDSNKNLVNFANVVVHDIRSPLRTISGFTTLLSNRYRTAFKEEDVDLQDSVVKACGDLTNLVEGILEFSKISSDSDLVFSTVDLNKLFKEITFLEGIKIKEKKAELIIQENFPSVHGVKELLQQLFINLISNAIKFSSKENHPKIEISYQKSEANNLIVSVKDNGIGIPKDYQKEVFKLFKKLNSSKNYDGSGLGLSIAKRIIEKHNATIWIESESNKGTTVLMEFPNV
jgi:signal transduction histidine kinase